MSLCVRLIALSTARPESICVVADDRITSSFKAKQLHCACTRTTFFIRPSGHAGYPRTLAVVNDAAVNVGAHLSSRCRFHFFWIYAQRWGHWII